MNTNRSIITSLTMAAGTCSAPGIYPSVEYIRAPLMYTQAAVGKANQRQCNQRRCSVEQNGLTALNVSTPMYQDESAIHTTDNYRIIGL